MQQASLVYAIGQHSKEVPCQDAGDMSPHSRVATPLRAGLMQQLPAAALEHPGSPQHRGHPGSPVHSGHPGSPMCFSPSGRAKLPGGSPILGPGASPIASPHHEAMMEARQLHRASAVSVIAPGGGTGINGQVYSELGQDPHFVVDIVGRSRAPYDCYPEYWSNGGPPPNLATFAREVLKQGWAEKSDCFVFGSRGGQVVLPILWEQRRDLTPPVVCINGGCAMGLPRPVLWPDAAVSFLLIGGQDYFRGQATPEQYIAETRSRVPDANCTTAILFVSEMEHMPQAALLGAVLPLMLKSILRWKRQPTSPPREQFRKILDKLNTAGWSGRLMFTTGPSEWAPEVAFGPYTVHRHIATQSDIEASETHMQSEAAPIQVTRKDELKELLRAAVHAVQPGRGEPLAKPADKFVAAALAAQAARERRKTTPAAPVSAAQSPPPAPERTRLTACLPPGGPGLMLPIPAAGTTSPLAQQGAGYALLGGVSPGGSSPSRMQIPGSSPFGAPSPISAALGMGARFASPSPSGSGFSPTSPFSGSPMRPRGF